MKFLLTLLLLFCGTTIFAIQDKESCATLENIPNVVTTDIKAGIERPHSRDVRKQRWLFSDYV